MKKKILYHSNGCKALTGFGKHARNILKYLHNTGKYEIIEFANHVIWDSPETTMRPWKCQGSLPNNPSVYQKINNDPNLSKVASYGALTIDKAIEIYNPDLYLGVEDIWGIAPYKDRNWWNKINCMAWTTLDSLPILPEAIDAAKDIKNYYVWSSFAEKEMHRLGHSHVKTLHGAVDTETFFRMDENTRRTLRSFHGLNDEFIIGFVFRNQLRKSVPNLLEGFKIFKQQSSCKNAKLLLHTNWHEGWDIERLIKEKDIDPKDILTTYYCSACGNYKVIPFAGKEQKCPFCQAEKTFNTVNVKHGVDDQQLNEIYNLMDVYCHPFTSGGMEIPIFEAKLTELITLVTNYSCGEDSCTIESGGMPLEWAEYREPGTQFIKASTFPSSIAKQLKKVFEMSPQKLSEMGKKARSFVIENYSVKVVGAKLCEIIDAMPEVSYVPEKNETKDELMELLDEGKKIAVIMPESAGDVLWINSLMENAKKLYPEFDIYVITKKQFFPYIEDNPFVHKLLEYKEVYEIAYFLEGISNQKKYFDICFMPHVITQRIGNYNHNNLDRNVYSLYEN
jgi:glycosyltransferase involved in cell wall biosynthesis